MVSLGAGAAARRGRAPRRPSHLPLRLIALLAALAGLWVLAAPAMGEPECASTPNPVACENPLPGDPASDWQVQGVGDPTIQGFATSMSVERGSRRSTSRSTRRQRLPHRHPAPGLLRRRRGPPDRLEHPAHGATPPDPARMPEGTLDRADRLRQLGRFGLLDGAQPTPSRACTSPTWCATTPAAPARSRSWCATTPATRKSCCQTSDATWEAYNTYGGNSLYTCTVACPPRQPEHLQGRLRGLLQPPLQRRLQRSTAGPPTSGTPNTR